MQLDQFPYRLIPDQATAAELLQQAATVNERFTELTGLLVSIGQAICVGRRITHDRLFQAWIYSEFGWSPNVADAFLDAVLNYEVKPEASNAISGIYFAEALIANGVCIRELKKAYDLVKAYRTVMRGDASFARLPRSASRRPRRRLLRARITRRRSDAPTDDDSDCV